MKGPLSVRIRNNKNEYVFTLRRNITILCGDSGTGKTTLYRMVSDYSREGRASGVHAEVTGNRPIVTLEGSFWMDEIGKIRNSIVLVDEDSSFLRSEDFARAIRNSSNYYLLITRNFLYQLPYSVNEVYVVKGAKKKHFERRWLDEERMYHRPLLPPLPFRPELVITEDSNAGYEFFQQVCSKAQIECISAKGKSNIAGLVRHNKGRRVAVVADGAAFGAEIEDLSREQADSGGLVALFLPESFEWLVLRSGLVCRPDLPELEHPEEHVESEEFFSWERYFTDLLEKESAGSEYGHYRKDKLAPFYLQDSSVQAVQKVITPLSF